MGCSEERSQVPEAMLFWTLSQEHLGQIWDKSGVVVWHTLVWCSRLGCSQGFVQEGGKGPPVWGPRIRTVPHRGLYLDPPIQGNYQISKVGRLIEFRHLPSADLGRSACISGTHVALRAFLNLYWLCHGSLTTLWLEVRSCSRIRVLSAATRKDQTGTHEQAASTKTNVKQNGCMTALGPHVVTALSVFLCQFPMTGTHGSIRTTIMITIIIT